MRILSEKREKYKMNFINFTKKERNDKIIS